MAYYIYVENEKLNGCGIARFLNDETQNIEVPEDVFNAYVADPLKYAWSGSAIVENPDYEKDKAAQAREERILEIKQELSEIDLKSIRPARAGETERLEELETQAIELRKKLQELTEV